MYPFNLLVIATLLISSFIIQVECLNFSYPKFDEDSKEDLDLGSNSSIYLDAIQVTIEPRGASITNLSGRAWHKHPFKLYSRRKNITASFNSTFVLNITPQTDPGGEGLAFILTETGSVPENSHGQWLGIVNASTNGSPSSNIVAVEFDTKKSYSEDMDDNHVGVDLNSINSIKQESLNDYGFNISSGNDTNVSIHYDGESKHLVYFCIQPEQSNYFDASRSLSESSRGGFCRLFSFHRG